MPSKNKSGEATDGDKGVSERTDDTCRPIFFHAGPKREKALTL
jgi:hypothetical protein